MTGNITIVLDVFHWEQLMSCMYLLIETFIQDFEEGGFSMKAGDVVPQSVVYNVPSQWGESESFYSTGGAGKH
jgi:hypothetical protein